MNTKRSRMKAALTTVLTVAATAAGTGRGRPDDTTNPPTGESQEERIRLAEGALVLEREAYAYPAHGRRNPFLAPDLPSANAPGVEGIALLGIIHHPDPGYRVAVIRVRDGVDGIAADVDPASAPASRLRIGERRAGMRIVAIELDHVVVELDESGGTATIVLAMPRAEKGRGS